jgi:hypothetical protein
MEPSDSPQARLIFMHSCSENRKGYISAFLVMAFFGGDVVGCGGQDYSN